MSEDVPEIPSEEAAAEAVETVEAAEIHADEDEKREETPVLDVHMSHATHTWKDFFIHIATICVGLLIAISLEQTVEYFHRLHERHVLEGELGDQCKVDHLFAEIDLAEYDARLTWLLGLTKDIDTMLATGGKANLADRRFQSPPRGHGVSGSGLLAIPGSEWEMAHAEGRLALLPQSAHKVALEQLNDRIADYVTASRSNSEVSRRQQAFADQFSDPRQFGSPMLSRMSANQLMTYRGLVMDNFEETRAAKHAMVNILADSTLLQSDVNWDNIVELLNKASQEAFAAHPDDYDKMEKEIDAEDAARDGAVAKPTEKR
jgi:hypothetical protein